jgi:ABC-2 type transport system permease protein
VQWLLSDYHGNETKRFAVIDRTTGARLFRVIEKAVEEANEEAKKGGQDRKPFEVEPVSPEASDEQRVKLSEEVRKGKWFAFVDIGKDVLKPATPESAQEESHTIRYQSNRPMNRDFPRLLREQVLDKIPDIRFETAEPRVKAPLEQVKAIMEPVQVKLTGLARRNPATGQIEDGTTQSMFAPVIVPIGLMMLMFMVVMMSATPLMQGVVEEKMQRIAEVLLGSVRPFDLMLGKLLGMTAVSMTISSVYLGSMYWAARQYGFAEYIPADLLVWFLVFQALAALMYGSLFIAVGAACTDMKETQNLMWPVMLLIVLPMFLMGSVLQEPNSTVATGLSFFPFATPMLMIMRQSVPPGIPAWQPQLGVALVLAMTLLCVWAAGRIFRVGILMQGKGAQMGEMMRWIIHG